MQTKTIQQLIRERILVLDGAMGTMIQQYNLSEADFRGERFKEAKGQLKGKQRPAVPHASGGDRRYSPEIPESGSRHNRNQYV